MAVRACVERSVPQLDAQGRLSLVGSPGLMHDNQRGVMSFTVPGNVDGLWMSHEVPAWVDDEQVDRYTQPTVYRLTLEPNGDAFSIVDTRVVGSSSCPLDSFNRATNGYEVEPAGPFESLWRTDEHEAESAVWLDLDAQGHGQVIGVPQFLGEAQGTEDFVVDVWSVNHIGGVPVYGAVTLWIPDGFDAEDFPELEFLWPGGPHEGIWEYRPGVVVFSVHRTEDRLVVDDAKPSRDPVPEGLLR